MGERGHLVDGFRLFDVGPGLQAELGAAPGPSLALGALLFEPRLVPMKVALDAVGFVDDVGGVLLAAAAAGTILTPVDLRLRCVTACQRFESTK